MADSGRPTGPRDSRPVLKDAGRTPEPRPSGRITAPRTSASREAQGTPPPKRTVGRKTILAGASAIVILVSVIVLLVRSGDDDDPESRAAGAQVLAADPHAAAGAVSNPAATTAEKRAVRRADVAPPPASTPTGATSAPIGTAARDAGAMAAATPVPIGTGARDAGAVAPPTAMTAAPPAHAHDAGVAHAHTGSGGAAPIAETKRATQPAPPSVKAAGSVDAGASAVAQGGTPALPGRAVAAQAARIAVGGRLPAEDDGGGVRVARFAPTGGVDLTGRVVDTDTGRGLSGTSVEATFEGRSVAVETDASGAFKMPGMVPGSRVLVWVGGRRDRMVAERFNVNIPDKAKTTDMGAIRLLDGDELASRLDGWIGMYVARQDDQIQVSAINAWVPAYRAGIQVGDVVLSVNGRDVRPLGARAVGFLLRGPIGSSVTLEIESKGKRRKLNVERVAH